jgi:hypothetical protein
MFRAVLMAITCGAAATSAFAQASDRPYEVALHVAIANGGEFDASDSGLGGRVAWNPVALLGAEAEITYYPDDYAQRPAFSASRIEGFFGATIGPRLGRFRPFVKLRPGFLTYRGAPEPFACILIFPPPLACTLAGGDTIPALDLGGGVELSLAARAFFRVDASDRVLRYSGPVIDASRTVRERDFWSHNTRLAIAAGFRF